jgi:hypothetical protein
VQVVDDENVLGARRPAWKTKLLARRRDQYDVQDARVVAELDGAHEIDEKQVRRAL